MNRLMFRFPLMAEAGDPAGGGDPAPAATTTAEPTSAAAAHTDPAPAATTAEPTPAAAPTNGAPTSAEPTSAAAAHTGAPAAKPGEPAPKTDPEPAAVDLEKTSDDDYAKLVQPDVEGQEIDRSLITPMAAELRKAGIQPSVMAKVGEIYKKVVSDSLAKDKAQRDENAKKLADEAEKAFTKEDWADFSETYKEHIAKDPELNYLVCHTELGSNQTFIRICNLVGATLRAEKSPPASAAAASSQTDLDRAVFEQTVPKHLR